MESFSKAEVAILSVLLGWILGQGAELIKAWTKRRSLVKAFKTELHDLKSHLEESKRFCIKGMDGLKKGDPALVWPQNAVKPIYDNYYKDICILLKETDRRMVNHIFGHIAGFHETIDKSNTSKNAMLCYYQLLNDIFWAIGTIECYLEGKSNVLNEDEVKYQKIKSELIELGAKYLT